MFVDIGPDTLNMDERKIEAALTPRTKVVMAIHQIGRPAELAALAEITRRRGLILLEDAACAIGSAYRGRPSAAMTWAPLVCFSFHPRKVLSTGDGGMITTGDAALARRLRLLRQHGMSVNDLERHQAQDIVNEEYPILGYNYRLTDVQAAIGLAQLRPARDARGTAPGDRRPLRRGAGRCARRAALPRAAGLPLEPADLPHPPARRAGRARDIFMQALLDDGIATRRGVMSIHREACYVERFGRQSFPDSEAASDQCVCLPLYTQMTDAEIEQVVAAVRRHAPRA